MTALEADAIGFKLMCSGIVFCVLSYFPALSSYLGERPYRWPHMCAFVSAGMSIAMLVAGILLQVWFP